MTAAPDPIAGDPIAGDPIERVLGEHRESWQSDGDYCERVWLECAAADCDWNDREPLDDFQAEQAAFTAHVAAKVREALQPTLDAAKAEAWDEGYEAATFMARCWGHTDHWEDEPDNPYRAAALTPPQQGREDEGVSS